MADAASKMETYEQLAKGWETDRIVQAERSRRVAWWIAGSACVLCGVLGIAIAGLTPLKRIEPFVIRVDQSTGAVEAVSRLTDPSKTANEAVNKYFVSKYVRAREEYSRELASVNYRTVALMSAPQVGQLYHDWFKPENEQSPLRVYGNTATVTVRILNVSFLGPNIGSVRYEKTVRRGAEVARSTWVATVTFRYSTAPMTEDDRLVNPLGFEVTDYRNDPEVGN